MIFGFAILLSFNIFAHFVLIITFFRCGFIIVFSVLCVAFLPNCVPNFFLLSALKPSKKGLYKYLFIILLCGETESIYTVHTFTNLLCTVVQHTLYQLCSQVVWLEKNILGAFY